MNGLVLWRTTLRTGVRPGGKLWFEPGIVGHVLCLRFAVDRPRPPAPRFFTAAGASGQDTRPGSAQATRTATVGDTSGHPSPSTWMEAGAHPHRARSDVAAATSSAA